MSGCQGLYISLYICQNQQKCTIPKVNSKVNYGSGVIMMCQCILINCNKRAALMWAVNSGGGYVCEEKWG